MSDRINLSVVIKNKISLSVKVKSTISVAVILANTVVGATLPVTYNWPQQTGQTTSFRTGDDADIEATVFATARVVGRTPKLANFLTLVENNSFGNTDRFTNSKGGSVYDGSDGSIVDYAIDNYTGLGWEIPLQATGTWNNQIDGAVASAFGGFSDWFLPNVAQYQSIMRHQVGFIFNYSPFLESQSSGKDLWTSTTIQSPTTSKLHIDNRQGDVRQGGQGGSKFAFYCRKHF